MKTIIRVIKKHKTFLISTHVNPDPDALCSELALAGFLRARGKKVLIVNHKPLPQQFRFLPGSSEIKSYKEGQQLAYDVAIVVDCGDLDRIGKVQDLLQEGKALINIDHHITNDRFGDINLVQPKASSTAEVLYDLLAAAKHALTKDLAMHLYIGIMTDTGSFRYENTSARTHAIVAKLMEFKYSVPALYRKLYEMISFRDLKEFTKVISHFDIFSAGKIICVELTKTSLSKFSQAFDLRDAIFRFLRSIKGVEVFVILTEIERNKTRVNLRSSNKFDVAKLANYFHGGGHRRASGCMIHKNISKTRTEVIREIKKAL
ncbi:MAG: bifunctional oligoribonuclease/PAP phosphatase NrnA [Candidatus Omnitrophota bacterium]